MAEVFVIVSPKHTKPSDKYITFWRPDRCGYCWPLSWAGHYDAEEATKITARSRGDSFSVPLDVALALAQPPAPGDVDGNAGPVVRQNKDNVQALRAAAVHQ